MSEIPIAVATKLMYDIHTDGCIACHIMGYPDKSVDVAKAEHSASEQRMGKVRPFFNTIEGLAELLATLQLRSQLFAASRVMGYPADMDPSMFEMAIQQHKEALLGSVSSILSVMVDEGMLQVREKVN